MTTSGSARTAARRAARDVETTRLFAAAAQTHSDPSRRELVIDAVLLNLHVAYSTARRFEGRGIPTEDLEQVASLALWRAAQRFDPAKGRDFLTYAVPFITGELKHHFRDHGWMVRPPRRVQAIQSRVVDAYRSGVESGHRPSLSRLAEQLELSEQDVREAFAANGCFLPQSLDEPVSPDGGSLTLGESLPDGGRDDLAALEDRLLLASALAKLSRQDRYILHLRFVAEKSQDQIARELGVGQTHVSRQLMRIFADLRSRLEVDQPDVA